MHYVILNSAGRYLNCKLYRAASSNIIQSIHDIEWKTFASRHFYSLHEVRQIIKLIKLAEGDCGPYYYMQVQSSEAVPLED